MAKSTEAAALASHYADWQIRTDRARTSRFPDLLSRKMARMSASPLAFLRGAAPLFYDLLKMYPNLAAGPEGEGWIVGDLHLENFGAYHPNPFSIDQRKKKKRNADVVFDLNDFDDALIAPWRIDLLRLTTSLLLGGRELGANGTDALDLCERLTRSYVAAAFHGQKTPEPPKPVRTLMMQVGTRSRLQLLNARTRVTRSGREFVRGLRYAELPPRVVKAMPQAIARYVRGLEIEPKPKKRQMVILDCALRIAGTGSLGGLRVATLVRGKGDTDGAWILDVKEEGAPSGAIAFPMKRMKGAERVVTALRSCVASPPMMAGTTDVLGLSMLVRKLTPQEDKLDLTGLRGPDLPALAAYLGSLVGHAHRRGATKPPKRAWKKPDVDGILERAIEIAGIHEAVYLALSRRIRAMHLDHP